MTNSKVNSALLVVLLALLTANAFADDHSVDPSRVLSVVVTDWNDDGSIDRAVLVDTGNDDGVDLHIYLDADGEEKTSLIKGGFAWRGTAWGQQPKLSLNSKQSLVVHSENIGIGRNAWELDVTIAWRYGQFVVAGYTYNSYDRLDPDSTLNCDFNLLSGGGIRNGKRVKIEKTNVPLMLWRPDGVEKLCFGEEVSEAAPGKKKDSGSSEVAADGASNASPENAEAEGAESAPATAVTETIPETPIAGGVVAADLKDPDVIAAAEYAAEDAVRYNHENSDAGYLHQVIQADQQVVAGMKYFLLIQVLFENGPVYRVEVVRNPQGYMSVEKSERVN